eukprot:6173561-Pleurochrysis_carterae.AAC.1
MSVEEAPREEPVAVGGAAPVCAPDNFAIMVFSVRSTASSPSRPELTSSSSPAGFPAFSSLAAKIFIPVSTITNKPRDPKYASTKAGGIGKGLSGVCPAPPCQSAVVSASIAEEQLERDGAASATAGVHTPLAVAMPSVKESRGRAIPVPVCARLCSIVAADSSVTMKHL